MASAPPLDHDDTPREDHIVHLRGVSWEVYEQLLEARGESSAPRLTYLDGVLEIMSPSRDHEGIKSMIGRLLEAWCIDRGIDLKPYGSWTLKAKKKKSGAEPDECYIFGTEDRDRPQLAIEVEWTSGRLDKLEVYARLGVEEVWWWRKGVIEVHVRRGNLWHQVERSPLLPELDITLLASFLHHRSLTQAVREFRAAVAAGK